MLTQGCEQAFPALQAMKSQRGSLGCETSRPRPSQTWHEASVAQEQEKTEIER